MSRLILAGFALWLAGNLAGTHDWTLGVELGVGLLSWIMFIVVASHVIEENDRGRQARHVLRVIESTLRRRANEQVDPLDDATLVDVFNAIRRAKKEHPVLEERKS